MVALAIGVVAACLYRYAQTKKKRFLMILGLFAIGVLSGLAAATVAFGWLH